MNRNQKYRKAQPTQLNWSSQTLLATFSCIIVIVTYHQVLVSRASARLTPYYRLSTMFAAAHYFSFEFSRVGCALRYLC